MWKYQATIGIDFLSKTMYLEDCTVRLQLWYVSTFFFSQIINSFQFNNKQISQDSHNQKKLKFEGILLDKKDLEVWFPVTSETLLLQSLFLMYLVSFNIILFLRLVYQLPSQMQLCNCTQFELNFCLLCYTNVIN